MTAKKFYVVLETKNNNNKYYVCACPVTDQENVLIKVARWAGKDEIITATIVATKKEASKRVEFFRQGYISRGLYAVQEVF